MNSSVRPLLVLAALLLASAFAACGTNGDDPGDADAGTSADAGSKPDAGTKADAGTPDAGSKPDAGTPDAGIDNCGAVTELGECDGDEAIWCDENEVTGIDCTEIAEDEEGNVIGGACAVLQDWGSWCAVTQGTLCAFVDEDESDIVYACGTSAGADLSLACDLDEGCVPTTATCSYPGDDEFFTPVCDGNRIIVDCTPWNQAVEFDCTSVDIGATGCDQGACVGIPAGGGCDGDMYKCAEGLVCNPQTEECE